jgi:succinyl-diaminopimelate desuccinylase
VIEAVRSVTGIAPELSRSGGTSDGRFIADVCPEVIELGPVGASIHKVDERVRIADLDALSTIYAGILERLLAPAAGAEGNS